MAKTSIGLSSNITAVLAYFFGFVSGVIFLLVEKQDRFVRFHAMQSTILFGGYFVLSWILSLIPVLDVFWALISLPLGLALFILWIYLMYQAYQGREYHLPILGDLADQQLKKL